MSEEFQVRKFGAYVPVSCCVLTDNTGVNHCKHPKPPPPTRWERTRWALRSWWWEHKPHMHLGPCEVDE